MTRLPLRTNTAPVTGALAAVTLAIGTAASCSASNGRPSASSEPPTPAVTSATATATPAPSGPGILPAGTLTLDEHAGSTTVRVRTGATVLVRLHSTLWPEPASSAPRVLSRVDGGPTRTTPCPPGAGCGVSAARFTAAHPGVAHVTAHRNSCGEARGCPPGEGDYEVTVVVTA